MAVNLLELKPNRSLLNSNFDGYKLYLSQISEIKLELKTPVDQVLPDVNNYSLLHAKYYGLHNHLVGAASPTDEESVYFIDKFWRVRKVFEDPLGSQQLCIKIMWEMPHKCERKLGDYNASMKIISENLVAVADGSGFLYILERNSIDDGSWKLLFGEEVLGEACGFIISDGTFVQKENEEIIHLLLLTINHKTTDNVTNSLIHWITLTKNDAWHKTSSKQLISNGFIQYLNFEHGEAIYVASDSGCKLITDSENTNAENESQSSKGSQYTWLQTGEDIVLVFNLCENPDKSLINVKSDSGKVEVKYGDETLLDGDLYQEIVSDLTHWTVSRNLLEIVLTKSETGVMWPEIVNGDTHGKLLEDPAALEEAKLISFTSDTKVRSILMTTDFPVIGEVQLIGRQILVGHRGTKLIHPGLDTEGELQLGHIEDPHIIYSSPPTGITFNSQQVEECDFECDKFTVFERICTSSLRVTHRVNLGSNQILLNVKLDPSLPPAFGLRNDVDICVWQPCKTESNFSLDHSGTLLAMGYIQASKQKKFLVCSPDMSYTVVSEASKHLFVYCQNKNIPSQELKNRKTGQRSTTISQQRLINLASSESILGVYAFNSTLFVLQENSITAFKI